MLPRIGLYRHVINISLVQHHVESGIAYHPALLVLGHKKAGLRVEEFFLQHGFAPRGGETQLLQLGDLRDVLPGHGDDLVIHNGSPLGIFRFPFYSAQKTRPSFRLAAAGTSPSI